jgi:hypothetical protein
VSYSQGQQRTLPWTETLLPSFMALACTASGMESVSILRVKRKRTAAASPLDGFVLEPTAAPRATKRQRVFRFAETVPFDSFASVEQTHALHQRIHALSAQPELPSSQPSDDAPVSAQSALYRVMPQHTQSGSLKILDVEQQAQERQKRKVSRAPRVTARRSTEEASNEMDQFVPMLKEYLSRTSFFWSFGCRPNSGKCARTSRSPTRTSFMVSLPLLPRPRQRPQTSRTSSTTCTTTPLRPCKRPAPSLDSVHCRSSIGGRPR